MNAARYAPAAVLALWAVWSATIDGISDGVWLLILVMAIVVQAVDLRGRYRR